MLFMLMSSHIIRAYIICSLVIIESSLEEWLEFLKDYDKNVFYHPGKTNVFVDALSRVSMDNVAHVEEEKKELAKYIHRLAC